MVQWHLIGRMVLQYLQLSGYTLGEGWLECFCLLSAWHLIDSPVEMYWQAQWLYGGLPIGGVITKWHPIGSRVVLEWLVGTY